MRYYQLTFLGTGVLSVLCLVGFLFSLSLNSAQQTAYLQLQEDVAGSLVSKAHAEGEVRAEEENGRSLRTFLAAWKSQMRPAPAKELGLYVRGALTKEADKLSLAYDGVNVPPEPARFVLGSSNRTVLAQKNSITVTSESLPTLITWLGQVEQQLPFARVESASLSAYGSRSVQLSVSLYFPIEEDSARPAGGVAAY